MLLGQGWVIGQMFGSATSETQIEQFIRTGSPGSPEDAREPKNAAAEEMVAEILRTGRLVVRC